MEKLELYAHTIHSMRDGICETQEDEIIRKHDDAERLLQEKQRPDHNVRLYLEYSRGNE